MTASGTIGTYPKFYAHDLDGTPLEGGKLYSYLSGTSTPLALYHDAELTSPWDNPIILDSSGEALFYYGPARYKLALHDAQDVPQWVIDPVAGSGGGAAAAGMGLGSNTVELRPGASGAQAGTVVFPASVLAMGLTVWITETFGTSQGLTHLGIGTVEHPDCWGVLSPLTADTETHAGVFLGYSGHPMPGDGTVTLTAYGGAFDGTGAVYLTGHFATFAPSHALGLSWTPPGPPSPEPPAPQPYATETTPGVIELLDAAEVLADTDTTRALTIGRLVSRTGTPSRLGLLRTATPAAVVTGTNDTDAATPLGVAQALAPVIAVKTTQTSDIAALQGHLPAGTPLSVPRYASDGQTLESSPLSIDATPLATLTDVDLVVRRTSGASTLAIEGVAGSQRILAWRTGTLARWMLLTTTGAESGSNVGSDLQIVRRDDAGASLGAMLHLQRTSGNLGLGTTLNVVLGSGAAYQLLNVKGAQLYVAQSSTQERPLVALTPSFVVSTDATRTARLTVSTYDSVAAREGLRLEADGAAARLGFFGGAAVAKPTVTGSRGANAALASALTALSSLGLLTDSSTA
jgi:hypothetical protein